MDDALDVEVFPVAPDRWIAVVRASNGEFSTEAESPSLVADAIDNALMEVLGTRCAVHVYDDLGEPWDVASAEGQLARLLG